MKIGSKIQRINRWSWVVGGSKIGEQDEEVQISSYKINKIKFKNSKKTKQTTKKELARMGRKGNPRALLMRM